MCESTCDTLASSAANQGDNTVSVAHPEKKKQKKLELFELHFWILKLTN